MSAAAAQKKSYTAKEYLELERGALDKHEFFDGEIFKMPGASYEHNVIVGNLITTLSGSVGRTCRVLPSDLRIFVPATGLYTYPDVSLLSVAPVFVDDRRDTISNPEAIFEVLSDSTESYDRGNKFGNYRSIPTLAHYVLVAQDKKLVEHFARQPGGDWLLHVVPAGKSLVLPWGEVPIDPLYRWVLS